MPGQQQKIAVLISGSGTNLQALIDADLPISKVISNRKSAYGLTRAQNHRVPTAYLALAPYLKKHTSKNREDYDEEIANLVLSPDPPTMVVLAGWMHVFSERFLDKMQDRDIPVINLHPALPTQFDGANALERAWEAWKRGEINHTGVMVHRVIKDVDRGEPIVVREIEFREGEEKEEFEERLHHVEWEVIVEATKMVLKELDERDKH